MGLKRNPLYANDKYSCEAALTALHERDVDRTITCSIAGLSVAADSLSAIKYAKVKPVRGDIKDKDGNVVATNVAIDFEIQREYPQYGNNDNRVDDIACDLVERFMKKIQKLKTYRNAVPTQSVLTITSNVVYGRKRATSQMAVVLVHHSDQVRTQCTVVTKKVQ